MQCLQKLPYPPMARLSQRSLLCACRFYSTGAAPVQAPPMLLKIRSDLKTAMKNKDTTRLNVLRAILAEVTNAAKTSKPIQTNMQLHSLLRKRAEGSKSATVEFKAANREDLVAKEEGQLAVLEEYAGGIEVMSESDIQRVIDRAVAELQGKGEKPTIPSLVKTIFAKEGPLEGKPADRSQVAQLVKKTVDDLNAKAS